MAYCRRQVQPNCKCDNDQQLLNGLWLLCPQARVLSLWLLCRSCAQKPIYRCDDLEQVDFGNPHVFSMRLGRTKMLPAGELTAFHYWGWRGDASDPPSQQFLASTVEDRAMDALIAQIPLLQRAANSDGVRPLALVTAAITAAPAAPGGVRDGNRSK